MTRDWIKEAVKLIVADLTDRRGLRQSWEEIDSDVQEEIKSAWHTAIKTAWNKHKPK